MSNMKIREFSGKPVDLNDYTERFKSTDSPQKPELTKYHNLVFQEFAFEYIGDIDPKDRTTWPAGFEDNYNIRLDANLIETTDALSYDMRVNGWSTESFPPITTTCGEWKDGRGRVLSARVLGEKFIPVAKYLQGDTKTPVSDNTSNGLIANLGKYKRLTCMEDYVVGGIAVVKSGELPRNMVDIQKWLMEKCMLAERFDPVKGGILKKIAKQIFERTDKEKDLLDNRDGEDWKQSFVFKMPNGKSGTFTEKQVLVLMANTGTSAMKYFVEHVLKNGGTPKPLILYTRNTSQERAANDVKVFMERVKTFFAQSYQIVDNSIDNVDIKTPNEFPFEILGVIPNFRTKKQIELLSEYKLISVEEYIADGLGVSELKLVS